MIVVNGTLYGNLGRLTRSSADVHSTGTYLQKSKAHDSGQRSKRFKHFVKYGH